MPHFFSYSYTLYFYIVLIDCWTFPQTLVCVCVWRGGVIMMYYVIKSIAVRCIEDGENLSALSTLEENKGTILEKVS